MAPDISPEDQAALDLHQIMLQAMRSREGEILRFLGFVLAAIAGFFALPLVKSSDRLFAIDILLPSASILAIVLLFFGSWYALALSYNYRYLHIVAHRVQERLGLDRFQPDWEPSRFAFNWSLDYFLFGFAPEIFRSQLLLLIVLTILAGAAPLLPLFVTDRCPLRYPWLPWVAVGLCLLALLLISALAFGFYPRKYNERLQQANEK
jgi:hypothetical protein